MGNIDLKFKSFGWEVLEIKEIFDSNNNSNLAILHCVTKYPTDPKFVNLSAMNTLKKKLDIWVLKIIQ